MTPEYLISYCPELSVWKLTDCETWKQKAIASIAQFPAPLAAIFEKAKADPTKTQSVNFVKGGGA